MALQIEKSVIGKFANPDEFQGCNGNTSTHRCPLSKALNNCFLVYVLFVTIG